jgi:hypothetical protein
MRGLHPQYAVYFDQSYHRKAGLSFDKQRQTKMNFLSETGLLS